MELESYVNIKRNDIFDKNCSLCIVHAIFFNALLQNKKPSFIDNRSKDRKQLLRIKLK